MWRYGDLLPCQPETVVDIGTGLTPSSAQQPRRLLGLNHLYIKNDCQIPRGPSKTEWSPCYSVAREFEFDTLACASTGNLANSVALTPPALV